MNLDPRLLKLARKAALPLLVAVILGVLGGLAMILQARLLSHVVDGAFLKGLDLAALQPILIVLGGVILVRAGLTFGSEAAAARAAIRIKMFLREKLVQQLFARGPVAGSMERSGELATVVTQAVEAMDAYFSQYLPQLVLAVLIPVCLLAAVFPVDAISALVMAITAPLIPVFMVLIGKAAELVTRRQFHILQRMSAYFLDVLQGLAVLKAYNQSQAQVKKVAETSHKYGETTLEVLRVTFLSAFALEMIGTISTAIVAVQIGLRVLYLGMDFEQAFFILLLAPEFYFPLRQLGLRFHAAATAGAAAKRVFDLLGAAPEMKPGVYTAHPPDIIEQIDFRQVGFRYGKRQVDDLEAEGGGLEGVTMTLRRGERTALIGPNGAGKTTLSYLLLRFIEPQSGSILVNGAGLSDMAPAAWRQRVSWVPQAPYLFAGSLAENICLGKPEASPVEMRRAAQEAFLDEWIESLPSGYQTRLGEGGMGISGGQLQRIAIARAFLKNSPVVILDEPTAHLDPLAEEKIEQAIDRLCAGRVVMVIAHHRKTIFKSQRVYVMEHGRVVQVGSPADLVNQAGLFARLYFSGEGTE